MNKNLLRQIKPSTKSMAPQLAASLIRMIEERTRGAKTRQEAVKRVAQFLQRTVDGLRKRGLPQEQILDRIEVIALFASNWIDLTFALLRACFSPAILLLLCLKTTLDSNLTSEQPHFTFSPPKGFMPLPDAEIGGCARNDSLPAPAIN